MLSVPFAARRLTRLPAASLSAAIQRSPFYHKASADMSLQESRRRVVPSLWDRIFREDFDAIEKMLAPGFAYEVWPEVYRPIFTDLPRTGIFDPEETIKYFKQIREKMLTEPTEMNVTDQSVGENSLQSRFVTKGRDENGKPYDIKHSLFLEFEGDGDKIKRGVEYIGESSEGEVFSAADEAREEIAALTIGQSDSMNLHLKREQGKDWQPLEGAAQTSIEGQQKQQAQVEAKQPETASGGGPPAPGQQAQPVKEKAA
ncbi:hypothetical protein JCM3774_004792 [Rhodotorula dairenensis]